MVQILFKMFVMKRYLIVFLIFFTSCALAKDYYINGEVVKVADGDTLTIITEHNRKLKIRLFGIDAPESSQKFGTESAENLKKLCLNKQAKLVLMDVDKYKRLICIVSCDGINANISQLQDGFAWAYTKYLEKEELKDSYVDAENTARNKKAGLWGEEDPTPPWKYRRKK